MSDTVGPETDGPDRAESIDEGPNSPRDAGAQDEGGRPDAPQANEDPLREDAGSESGAPAEFVTEDAEFDEARDVESTGGA
ncbi:MAG: hypothetical protein KY469_10185 [Actinobacteria bacterium]|nr:hypothetical protein [Actinomycetota bacterium]